MSQSASSDPEVARRHLTEVRDHPRFRHSPLRYRLLEILVEGALKGRKIESVRHLAELVYGNEPAYDGTSEAYYNRAKSNLSTVRRYLREYYAELQARPAVMFVLSEKGFDLRIVLNEEAETEEPVPSVRDSRVFRFAITAAVLIAAVAILIVAWTRLRQPLPAGVKSRDGFPVLVDVDGRIIEDERWQSILGAGKIFSPKAPGHMGRTQEELAWIHVKAALMEGGPAGSRDFVAVAEFLAEDQPGHGRLSLYDRKTSAMVESIPIPVYPGAEPPTHLHFLTEEGKVATHFHVIDLSAYDLDGDGVRNDLIVGISMADLFPSLIVVVEAAERLTVRRYHWFAGHVSPSMPVDLDGDRVSELLVTGTNNDYEQAILAVLRLDELPGRTPLGPRKKIFREILDLEENGILIRFPRTEVSKSVHSRTRRDYAGTLIPFAEPGHFLVEVVDVSPTPPLRPGESIRIIQFELGLLDGSVRVDFNRSDDFYLTEMKRLIEEGEVEDRWGIMETGSLERYAEELETRVILLDPRNGEVTGFFQL